MGSNNPPASTYGNMGWAYMYASTYNRYISSGYKLSERPDHYGFDIISTSSSYPIEGSAIKCCMGGTVAMSKKVIYNSDGTVNNDNGGAGNYIVIKTNSIDPLTGNYINIRFLHMKNSPLYLINNTVTAGTILGYTGTTGDSSGPHLHFDVNNANKTYGASSAESINPQKFFPNISFSGKTSLLD